MGVLFDTYRSAANKKRCTVCGCLMDGNHDGDVCEVCIDELFKSDPGEEVDP